MISEVSFCGSAAVDSRMMGKSAIRCAAVMRAISSVWIGMADGTVVELDSRSGDPARRLDCSSSKDGPVNFIVDFGDVVAVGFGRGVSVVTAREGATVQQLATSEVQGAICGISIGDHLFVGGICGKIAVWDLLDAPKAAAVFVRSLAAHSGAVTCIAVPSSTAKGWFLGSGSATGEVVLWTEDRKRCVAFRHIDAPVTALLFVSNGPRFSLWCGFGDGLIRIWSEESTDAKKQFRAHASGVTALCKNDGEEKVWSTGVDGHAASWDLTGTTELLRIRHSGEVVGLLPVARVSVWRLWLLSMQGGLQCYVAQAGEIESEPDRDEEVNDDGEYEAMKNLADDAMNQVHCQHDEIQRLAKALSQAQSNSGPNVTTAWLEEEESVCRCTIAEMWSDTTETAFVSFLISSKTVGRAVGELRAVSDERDFLKNLLASISLQEMTGVGGGQAKKPTNDVALSPLRAGLPLVLPDRQQQLTAELSEKDHQLRMLQNELVQQRRIAVDNMRNLTNESASQLRMQQQSLDDERAARSRLSQELLSLETRCNELSRQNDLLQDALKRSASEAERMATAAEQRAKAAAKASHRAVELELAELRLGMQRQQEAHAQECAKWNADIFAMKKPWEAMKKALNDAHTALEQSRAEFRTETASLEGTIRRQQLEIEALRRTSARH
jgi:hypothetical protein